MIIEKHYTLRLLHDYKYLSSTYLDRSSSVALLNPAGPLAWRYVVLQFEFSVINIATHLFDNIISYLSLYS